MSTPSTACRRLAASAGLALGLIVSAPTPALSQTPVAYGSGLAAEVGLGQASVGTGFGSSGMVALRAYRNEAALGVRLLGMSGGSRLERASELAVLGYFRVLLSDPMVLRLGAGWGRLTTERGAPGDRTDGKQDGLALEAAVTWGRSLVHIGFAGHAHLGAESAAGLLIILGFHPRGGW